MILKPRLFRKPNLSHPLARGLVGCWLMNEGGGNNIYDLSGNRNVGTLVGNTKWVPGKYGPALNFDGTGDCVSIPTSTILKLLATDATFSSWINPNTIAGNDTIIGNGIGNGYWHILYNGYPAIYIGGSTTADRATANTEVVVGKWSHIVVVWESATKTATFYINGVNCGSGTTQYTINSSAFPIVIGEDPRDYAGYGFDGLIDNVMIFNRALMGGEVQQLYREPFCMFDRERIELWSAATQGGGVPPPLVSSIFGTLMMLKSQSKPRHKVGMFAEI